MPPRVTVSREQVVEAAFQIVRREGMAALSARRVAGELGCSTQPVYRACHSMAELREAVLTRAAELAMSFLLAPTADAPPFLQVGLGSLRFAQEEPHLHGAVGSSGPVAQRLRTGEPPPESVLERMKADPSLAGFTEEQLARVHALLWLFSQGVATLFQSEVEGDAMPQAQEYLMLAGRAVIGFEMNRSNT